MDITKAQECADLYSSALVSKYRDAAKQNGNADLMEFSVPNSVIKAVEVRLSFAVPQQQSTTKGCDRNLAISYAFDDLKELNDSVLSSITFQIEMRSYGLGYKERVQAGEVGTDAYVIPRE
jgi:hypothetical protein